METISERIMKVVEKKGLSKSDFARQIDVTPAYISKLSKFPEAIPSDRTIRDICKTFQINEDWLRTGEGQMDAEMSRSDEIAAFIGDVLSSKPDFRQQLISVLARLSLDEWKLLEKMSQELVEEQKKSDSQ